MLFKNIITITLLAGLSLPGRSQVHEAANGNVGIGTTTPQLKLHVAGPALIETNEDEMLTFNNTDNSWHYMAFKRSGIRHVWMGLNDGVDFYLNKETAGNIVLNAPNGSVYLNPSGNVVVNQNGGYTGIGTASPVDKLHVYGRTRIEGNFDNRNIGASLILTHSGKTAPGIARDWVLYNMSGTYGNSLQFWTYDNAGCPTGLCEPKFTLLDNGNVGIGTPVPKAKLAVNGDMLAHKLKVTLTNWPDYVFQKNYRLRPLSEVERFIQLNKHLPDVPAAAEVEKDGLDVGGNQAVLLKKIEELTLYLIAQNKKLDAQQKMLLQQQKEIQLLKKRNQQGKFL
jgi:hypothetical protein